ncbi:MAG: DUF1223 domain-containing protein [Pseudomonadota bacterium]
MRVSLIALSAILSAVLVLSLRGGAQTLNQLPPANAAAMNPVVAELFTSQSCSSCPPAEKLFADLAEREDLIVLEWHVDYWDRLVHGRAGAWKDPYSSADHTARQRQYNRTLRGTGGAYTPQAVINGVYETVGSQRAEIERFLSAPTHAMAEITVSLNEQTIDVLLGPIGALLDRPATISRLTLLPEQATAVPRGENRGVRLFSRNIVLETETIGLYTGEPQTLAVTAPQSGEACAIIVQEKRGNRLGPIIGASYCS